MLDWYSVTPTARAVQIVAEVSGARRFRRRLSGERERLKSRQCGPYRLQKGVARRPPSKARESRHEREVRRRLSRSVRRSEGLVAHRVNAEV